MEIVGVITAPERFSISYAPNGVVNSLHYDFAEYCRETQTPYEISDSGMRNPKLLETAKRWSPDIFVIVGWYHLIPKSWRIVAKCYGLHASLLPDYSGGAPLVWAMINGERSTGVTMFEMDDGVDSGDIVAQRATNIQEMDDIGSLYSKIEKIGVPMLCEGVLSIASGKAIFQKQDESLRRVFPQRSPDDGLIDDKRESREIIRFIRAQTKPYPGAFVLLNGKKLIVWKAEKVPQLHKEVTDFRKLNQCLVMSSDRLLLKASNGLIDLKEVQFEGQDLSGQQFIQRF